MKRIKITSCFQWIGTNAYGEHVEGSLNASNRMLAKAELYRQGIFIKKIVQKRSWMFTKNINPNDIVMFSRQLSTLVESGISLGESFKILIKLQKNDTLKQALQHIKQGIDQGFTLTESLRKYPKLFDDLFCNLIHAGEISGTLDIMLGNLARHQEKIMHMRQKIKKALAYPFVICIMTVLMTIGLLWFVVPQFESMFEGLHATLPTFTQDVIAISKAFQKYGLVFLSLFLTGTSIFLRFKKTSPKFSHLLEHTLLRLPILGHLLEKSIMARFARTLYVIHQAGLPLSSALESAGKTTGYGIYQEASHHLQHSVLQGESLSKAMERSQIFPLLLIQWVNIGETSGTLEQMLMKAVEFYETSLEHSLDILGSLLEPLLMALLGVLIGSLVIAMYLPIFKLGAIL